MSGPYVEPPTALQKFLSFFALAFAGLFLNSAILMCGMEMPVPPNAPPNFPLIVLGILAAIPTGIVGLLCLIPPRAANRRWSGAMLLIVGGLAGFSVLTVVCVALDPAVEPPPPADGDLPVDVAAMFKNWPFAAVAAGTSMVFGWLLMRSGRPPVDEWSSGPEIPQYE